MRSCQKLEEKYSIFKENLSEAFSFFLYSLSTGKSWEEYIENKRDIKRIQNRECELERPKSSDDIKPIALKGLLKRLSIPEFS